MADDQRPFNRGACRRRLSRQPNGSESGWRKERVEMITRSEVLAVAIVIVSLVPVWVAGQGGAPTADTANLRTGWGDPDLQGVWTYKTITPLERPAELADKRVLTDEEAAIFEREENQRLNRDLIDPTKGGYIYAPESEGGVIPYNDFWYDRGTEVIETRQTSLIVDPVDGLLPSLTPEAQRQADAAQDHGATASGRMCRFGVRRRHPVDL